jgi:hypothetical protein
MKKWYSMFFVFVYFCSFYSYGDNNKQLVLPRNFYIGQEFFYDGILYTIKGFEQKQTASCEKVKLILEHQIKFFGCEFGKQMVKLSIKRGTDPRSGFQINSHITKTSYSYAWKTYILGLFAFNKLFPTIVIK